MGDTYILSSLHKYIKMPNTIKFVHPDKIHKSVSPLSKGVLINNQTLYISGQVGCDDSRNFPETVEEQTVLCMKNMLTVLEAAGMGWSNVVKITVMFTDPGDWVKINGVYKEYFEVGRFPARTAFHSAHLPLGTKVEMDGIAVMDLEEVE